MTAPRVAPGVLVAVAAGAGTGAAQAHIFTPPYTLPVPFSMYAFGSGAALVLSFVIVGLFASVPGGVAAGTAMRPAATPATEGPPAPAQVTVGKVLALLLLAICIVTGLLGTQNLYANFNMTFFWIVFVLGVPYLTAVIGDFYAALNPWKALVEILEAAWPSSRRGGAFGGVLRQPERWGCYPALLLYIAFIWIELFARVTPKLLSFSLLGYTLVNLAGAWLFGKSAWFRQGEFFGVMLRLIGLMSVWARPWDAQERAAWRAAAAPGRPRPWRLPFVGLLETRPAHLSLAVLVLFMISSTAFDGLHNTQAWVALFWKGLHPEIASWLGIAPGQQVALSARLYYFWQGASLVVSPLVYLAIFGACVALARWLTGADLTVRELLLRFVFSLVPIAFVYHVTHYYTMLLAQGGQVVRLASDPFGKGWNLLGTARWQIDPWVVEVGVIWHTQVALILLGHIASVYLAHVEALRVFPQPRRAAISQLPMLVLMVSFTAFGLWILSLPLSVGG
mgnify:CR=1 FL=1